MNAFKTWVARAVGLFTRCFWVGAAFAVVEFLAFYVIRLGVAKGGWFDHGLPGMVYGVRGGWQLLAHKVLAFGWITFGLALVFTCVYFLGTPFRERVGIKLTRAAVASAAGVYVFLEIFYVWGCYAPRPELLLLPSRVALPAAALFFGALLYSVGGLKVFQSLTSSRGGKVFAAGGFVIAAFLSYLPYPDRRPIPTGPNVVIITIDALRADRIGARGYDGKSLTPNIDRFAARATTFTRCWTAAPWTLPSLASWHTGLYPPVHGAGMKAPLYPRYTNLATLFYDKGYDTAAVVGNPMCEPCYGLNRGFRYYRSVDMLPGGVETRFYYTKLWWLLMTPERTYIDTTGTLRDRTVNYLRSRRGKKRPFFFWVHFMDPHRPYLPPSSYLPRLVRERYPKRVVKQPLPEGERFVQALYDGEVRFVDEAVGELLRELDAHDDRETVIIISADHGEELWDHGGTGHASSLYEEVLRIPFIFRVPGLADKGGTVTAQISSVDVFGTLAELCVLRVTTPTQSRSFVPLLKRRGDDAVRFAFATSPTQGDLGRIAVTDGKMKLIYSPGTQAFTCYDLASDPEERNPIGNPFILAPYLRALKSFQMDNERLKRVYGTTSEISPLMEKQLKAMGYIR